MRFIVAILFGYGLLFAKQFGVVFIDSKVISFDESVKKDIELIMKEQNAFYSVKNSVEVYSDKDGELKTKLSKKGSSAMVEFAKKKNWSSIAIVEYKKQLKRVHIKVIVADEIQDKKSTTFIYNKNLKDNLSNALLSSVLKLNYQLGVFDVKNIY